MFNDAEKAELRRIVSKFVDKGLCARPIHPEEVIREIKMTRESNATEELLAEAPPTPA